MKIFYQIYFFLKAEEDWGVANMGAAQDIMEADQATTREVQDIMRVARDTMEAGDEEEVNS